MASTVVPLDVRCSILLSDSKRPYSTCSLSVVEMLRWSLLSFVLGIHLRLGQISSIGSCGDRTDLSLHLVIDSILLDCRSTSRLHVKSNNHLSSATNAQSAVTTLEYTRFICKKTNFIAAI